MTSGLQIGDRLIVEGLQRVQPDQPVHAVPAGRAFAPGTGHGCMSRFFIDRPVFAWVIAIVIMLAGVLSILSLSIAQYPTIAPPAVTISASYPGASARHAAKLGHAGDRAAADRHRQPALFLVVEQFVRPDVTITVTFAPGTNPDIAQVQVQNKVQQATPLLPPKVQQQGIVVVKSQPNTLPGRGDLCRQRQLHEYRHLRLSRQPLQDPISRIPGVGATQVFGAQYAMRIWLNPFKLATYSLTPDDVRNAVQAQNTQVSAGELGALPAYHGQELDATVTAQSRTAAPPNNSPTSS